ncbi:leucine-rich colipase-like protein 1 isoform X2 [Lemur catta]|uniref:leucine-rich colipase-like protein 1 isoform X2 n=1 Tax=Lemur catta TaxID=9447 RepID=UPI001E26C5E2|nr:leucine-rich colipase-like protein 1 isoform X2 [Lemur catta]
MGAAVSEPSPEPWGRSLPGAAGRGQSSVFIPGWVASAPSFSQDQGQSRTPGQRQPRALPTASPVCFDLREPISHEEGAARSGKGAGAAGCSEAKSAMAGWGRTLLLLLLPLPLPLPGSLEWKPTGLGHKPNRDKCQGHDECRSGCCTRISVDPQLFCTAKTIFLQCVRWRKVSPGRCVRWREVSPGRCVRWHEVSPRAGGREGRPPLHRAMLAGRKDAEAARGAAPVRVSPAQRRLLLGPR